MKKAISKSHLLVAFVFIACLTLSQIVTDTAKADDYPSKPIKIVIPFKAGGSPPNVFARKIGEHLEKKWGEPVVVENRPGAGGQIATQYVAGQKPDGYTLMVGSVATHAIKRAMQDDLPVDTLTAFEPVTQLGFTPMLISAHPSLGVSTIEELVAKAKEAPNTITYASVGKGSAAHLTAELLQAAADIKLIHVPYPGVAKAKLDIVSGEVKLGFTNIVSMLQFIQEGAVKALAITGEERSTKLPDVATVNESYPGIFVELWWGIFAPAGTPPEVVNNLSTEINEMLKDKELITSYAEQATSIKGSNPEELKNLLQKDFDKWNKVITEKGLKQ